MSSLRGYPLLHFQYWSQETSISNSCAIWTFQFLQFITPDLISSIPSLPQMPRIIPIGIIKRKYQNLRFTHSTRLFFLLTCSYLFHSEDIYITKQNLCILSFFFFGCGSLKKKKTIESVKTLRLFFFFFLMFGFLASRHVGS